MRILVAPDKFKGSLTATEAAQAIARGIDKVLHHAHIELFPMADGGEGTVEVLVKVGGGKILRRCVCGPLGKPVIARFGLLPNRVAVIEMAEASGLHLVPPRCRNPLRTSTFGTGQLIRAAIQLGCREIIVGIGGSATVDGGVGMAQALGWKFFDTRGREMKKPLGGGDLDRIERIQRSTPLSAGSTFTRRQFGGLNAQPRYQRGQRLPAGSLAGSTLNVLVACDVTNPLLGWRGAARVFGPQKGATPAMVKRLERGLRHFARIVIRDIGLSHSDHPTLLTFPGAGAAGGLGFGLRAFLGARFASGAELVMRYGRFEEKLDHADLVITGEGRLDAQTLGGKAPAQVAHRAKRLGLPVLALAGSVAIPIYRLRLHGIDAAAAIQSKRMRAAYAMKHAARLLEDEAARVVKNFLK